MGVSIVMVDGCVGNEGDGAGTGGTVTVGGLLCVSGGLLVGEC